MDHNFTQKIKQWLDTPEENRDYKEGAVMVLQLSGNQIMYRNIMAAIDRRHDVVEYQLQKYYNFRVNDFTRQQVAQMDAKVDEIIERNIPKAAKTDIEKAKGKRDDHDYLPKEIRDLYVDNLNLLHRMREVHLKLRSLSLDNATCPDSERYPYLKELIELDMKLHSNWETYDHFVISPIKTAKKEKKITKSPVSSRKTASKKAQSV